MAAAEFRIFVERLRDPASPTLSPQRMAVALHIESQYLAALGGVHRDTLRASPTAPSDGKLESTSRMRAP